MPYSGTLMYFRMYFILNSWCLQHSLCLWCSGRVGREELMAVTVVSGGLGTLCAASSLRHLPSFGPCRLS